MTKLWQYTEAQAEAMSAANAAKVLAEDEEGYGGEASERALEGYVLDYETGSPRKDSHGNYILANGYSEIDDGAEMWRHWSKIYPQSEMMQLTVGEAKRLHPAVKKILEHKVKEPLKKFKQNASEKTKSAWERASDTVKATILSKWLRAKGHQNLIHDGGRRTTRRSRGRRTTRKH